MSQFALPVAELKPALIGLGKVLTRNAPLPVLASILMERTQEGWIALTTTDSERFVTVRLEQPAEGEPKALLVPFDELLKVTRTCNRDERIFIEQDGESHITIRHVIGNQFLEHKVQSCPAAEFPVPPPVTGEPISIPEPVRQSIHQAFACASTDPTRLILNGAYLDVSEEECHQVVATDGRHLFSSNSFRLPLPSSINLPVHPFLEWKEFRRDGEWQIQLGPQRGARIGPWFRSAAAGGPFLAGSMKGTIPTGGRSSRARVKQRPASRSIRRQSRES